MEPVQWYVPPPDLRNPAALIAFSGWGDAGESSTDALEPFLRREAVEVATIDPDDFFDFQVRRPIVRREDDGTEIDWPAIDFHTVPFTDRDLVVVRGEEPSFGWRKLGVTLGSVLGTLGVTEVVTMGAYVGHVVHTLPVPLVASAVNDRTMQRTGLASSEYEGPTGIIGVLNALLDSDGFDVISVWAAVPHYLSSQPYLPGALALGEKASRLLRLDWEDTDIRDAVSSYRHAVDVMVEDDDELTEYVRRVEAEIAEEVPSSNLVAEIERFLNENNG
ncbi:MAG: hypothetical protein GEU79_12945 [Acidimicrobiia bacterium]|nr:hypothetical protein [Acidimicrobiia bacterium]